MVQYLEVRGKKLKMPVFFPDATVAKVRGVSSDDLRTCEVEGVVVNIYHLLKENLIGKIHDVGGIHEFMDYNGVIISDSGGFQVMSLIHSNPELGYIEDRHAVFTFNNRKIILTPEKCVQMQLQIGSDIVMCLDDCTYPEMSLEQQEKSVERTISWAKRCKDEFVRQTKNISLDKRPLLFGIIQGGDNLELRKKCADELKKIGFDGYAFGGWPINSNGEFLYDLLNYTCELMPADKPRYAMGVGKPENITACVKMGYDMFDCVIPTREARNNRLYSFKKGFLRIGLKRLDEKGDFYEYVRIRNLENSNSKKPISNSCDCYACKNFTRSQIYDMFKKKDFSAIRLATMHNLRFYTKLVERLKGK